MVRNRVNYFPRKTHWDLPPVSLIVPVKGEDLGMEDHLAALFCQDYPDYEVVFVVEDRADPAVRLIGKLRWQTSGVPSRLVVAGRSHNVGQKVHNLVEATRNLPAKTRVLAFVDADAHPSPTWLRRLVDRLKHEGVGASTGYRWLIPERRTLANLVVCCANSSVAALFGSHGLNIIWGGSWAVRREIFDSCGVWEAWNGVLTEDVVAARVIRETGLRVEFEPGCLCPSPIDMNWRQSLAFMRRQFFLVRMYSPRVWALGLIYATIVTGVFWVSLAAAISLSGSGGPAWWLAVSTMLVLYSLGVARSCVRQQTARFCMGPVGGQFQFASWFDTLAAPISGLVAWGAMASAAVGRSTTWRSIRYELDARGQVVDVDRLDEISEPSILNLPMRSASDARVASEDRSQENGSRRRAA